MKNYLFLGDTHGDLDFAARAAELAAEHDADIIQVGDWGFMWPRANSFAALSLALQRAGESQAKPPVEMRFIDGNHDWHPELARLQGVYSDLVPYDDDPRVPIALHVAHQPRGSVYEDADGTRFLFCGGAPSIDYEFRTEGRSYWEKEEIISEQEFEHALTAEGPIHVLVTHDAPDYPPGFEPKGTPWFRVRSRRSMEMVHGLIVKHRPQIHVHGHWHHRYSSYYQGTTIYGLASNLNRFNDAVLLWSRE